MVSRLDPLAELVAALVAQAGVVRRRSDPYERGKLVGLAEALVAVRRDRTVDEWIAWASAEAAAPAPAAPRRAGGASSRR